MGVAAAQRHIHVPIIWLVQAVVVVACTVALVVSIDLYTSTGSTSASLQVVPATGSTAYLATDTGATLQQGNGRHGHRNPNPPI